MNKRINKIILSLQKLKEEELSESLKAKLFLPHIDLIERILQIIQRTR